MGGGDAGADRASPVRLDRLGDRLHSRATAHAASEAVEDREQRLADVGPESVEGESRCVAQLRKLRAVRYTELIALDRFIDGHTPFATKHGVKGSEFENVLVIVGRGWNKYNFAQMLEWIDAGPPADKAAFFESNRNLFYVACSQEIGRRPKVRLEVAVPRPWLGGIAMHSSSSSIQDRRQRHNEDRQPDEDLPEDVQHNPRPRVMTLQHHTAADGREKYVAAGIEIDGGRCRPHSAFRDSAAL